MAKPYREGGSWSFRIRIKHQDIYQSGFPTVAVARKELDALRHSIANEGRPAHEPTPIFLDTNLG